VTSASALGHRLPGEAVRWPICALVVLVLHAIGLAALIAWRAQPVPSEPVSVTLMMDLVPAPVPAPPPAAEIIEPEQPEIPIVVPEATPIKEPEIAIPPPPKPKPVRRKPSPQRAEKAPDPSPAAVEAPTSMPAPAPPASASPVPSVAAPPSPDAMTNFQRLLMARLDRAKRYPVSAQRRRAQGVAYLRFTMDRSGKVLAAQLERSSGHGDLDEEVLALIKRADPLPPIPPDLAQDRLELVVPVQFSLR
jgi:periplasmic protein TonB